MRPDARVIATLLFAVSIAALPGLCEAGRRRRRTRAAAAASATAHRTPGHGRGHAARGHAAPTTPAPSRRHRHAPARRASANAEHASAAPAASAPEESLAPAAPAAAPRADGSVMVTCVQPGEVTIDGQSYGAGPSTPLTLAAGAHVLTVASAELRASHTVRFDLAPGQRRHLVVDVISASTSERDLDAP